MYEKAPESITLNGKAYKIETDFRFWAEFTETVEKDKRKASDMLLRLAMRCKIPLTNENLSHIIKDFYSKAFEASSANGKSGGKSKKVVDFVHDAPLISAAFLAQYGINLETESLHWWDFIKLFFGLSEEHNISRIIGYRGADTSKMSKEQAAFYKKMQQIYKIGGKSHVSGGRRDFAADIERIKRRKEEALRQQTEQS